jgi:hypothetical protein
MILSLYDCIDATAGATNFRFYELSHQRKNDKKYGLIISLGFVIQFIRGSSGECVVD